MRWVAVQNVVWLGRRPAEGYVANYGVARRYFLLFCLLFSLPDAVEISRNRISELTFRSSVNGMYVNKYGRRVASEGWRWKEGSFRKLGDVAVGRDGYRGDWLGGEGRGYGRDRGWPWSWDSMRPIITRGFCDIRPPLATRRPHLLR